MANHDGDERFGAPVLERDTGNRQPGSRRESAPLASIELDLAKMPAAEAEEHSGVPASPGPAPDYARDIARFTQLREEVCHSARRQVDTLRILTAYRRINDELQNCFLALEKRLPAGSTALDLVFSDEPVPSAGKLGLGWRSDGVAQILPVASTGVSGIEINFSEVVANAGAVLHVHLLSLEDEQVIDRWTIPLERLSPGWAMLTLTRPLDGPSRLLDLRLDFESHEDASVALHLGAHQRVGLFQVRHPVSERALRSNGLAVQIWCGDPYFAHVVHSNILVADARPDATAGATFSPLSPTVLARAAHVNPEAVGFDFVPVSRVPYRVAVSCHPPATGFTLAGVPLPPNAHPVGLSVDLEVGNEKSKPVEFAAVLALDQERAGEILAGRSEPLPSEAFSGWVTVTPEARGALRAVTPVSAKRPVKVFLATRMLHPGQNSFAWARFRNIAIATLR